MSFGERPPTFTRNSYIDGTTPFDRTEDERLPLHLYRIPRAPRPHRVAVMALGPAGPGVSLRQAPRLCARTDRHPGTGLNADAAQPVNVSQMRATFIAMISPATTEAMAVVAGRFASAPMMSRRRVSSTSGTSANGIPNDSTTWE